MRELPGATESRTRSPAGRDSRGAREVSSGSHSRLGGAWAIGAAAVCFACVAVWEPPGPTGYRRTTPIESAEAIGGEECLVCHEDVRGRAPAPAYHADCEACHGPGSVHEDSEEPADIRFPSSADCLACHESGRETHLAWSTGEHERAGVLCSDCHDAHGGELYDLRRARSAAFRNLDAASSLCVQCHPDVAATLHYPSHHPVREGMLSCTDCHAPHGDRRTAFGGSAALCAQCHQDYVGPWIYEHAPVAEDCLFCHAPHGSPASNLLEVSQPALCLSCHTSPDDFHLIQSGEPGLTVIAGDRPTGSSAITPGVAGAFYTRCTDCHGAIHGSYQDIHLRR